MPTLFSHAPDIGRPNGPEIRHVTRNPSCDDRPHDVTGTALTCFSRSPQHRIAIDELSAVCQAKFIASLIK